MVEVTQADRELLIELISFDSETIDAILAGNAFTWEVEQIARHRIAAMEEAAKVADRYKERMAGIVHETAGDCGEAADACWHSDIIATAIRALKGPSNA